MRDFSEQKNTISIKTDQKIQMSLSMRQSLNVLQMPIEELSCWVEEQIEQNPLLDWKDSPSQKGRIPLEIEIAYEPSLFEYLMQQARENIHDERSLLQIEWIIGNLEDNGFFTTSLDTAPDSWNQNHLLSLLDKLQQFDPPGIGARNLQESLLLQLLALGKENDLSYILIKDHLDDIIEGRLSLVQRKCLIDEKTLHAAIYSEIGSLDPFPGLRFHKKITPFLTPDVFFLEEDGIWKIEINEEKLPNYSIRSFPDDSTLLSSEDKVFCKKHITQAKWIGSMIEKRRQTLYKVTNFLVKKQIGYLQEESPFLHPLSINEVAQELELHESTIARAVSNKFLACRWGIISLKSLLSKCVTKDSEDISSDQTQKLLQKLISEESGKKPLSDRELLEKMQKKGVHCARRTITKYRKSLNIPSGRFRKKLELF